MIGALLVSELRKTLSTKLWWGLLIPVALLSIIVNLVGGTVSSGGFSDRAVLISVATTLGWTGIFAVVFGIIAVSGEFRHRTISSTYLTAGNRGSVLAAKAVFSAVVGLLYAMAAVTVGLIAALLAQGSAGFGLGGELVAVCVIGLLVVAAWGAFGALIGAVISNQLAAVISALVYLLLVENIIQAAFNAARAQTAGYLLPGEAPGTALLAIAAGPELRFLDLPAWWVALAVFAGYIALAGAGGWLVWRRRDVT